MFLHRTAAIGNGGSVSRASGSAPGPVEASTILPTRPWRRSGKDISRPVRSPQSEFATWLTPTRIQCRQPITSKKRALERCAALIASDLPTRPWRTILDALMARERLGSTALDNGVALPHACIRGLDTPMAACLTLTEPVDFDAPDGREVDVILCVLLPGESDRESMRAVAAMLNRGDLAVSLRSRTEPAEVRAFLGQPNTNPGPVEEHQRPRPPRSHAREARSNWWSAALSGSLHPGKRPKQVA